jgi:hypothetical protein
MNDIHCTPAAVAELTGVSVPKQNQWTERGVIQHSRRDKKSTGSGDYRKMSMETIFQFAIANACAKVGIPARSAAKAARLFCIAQPNRPANELFEFNRTLLVFRPSGEQIINADYAASLTDICGRPFAAAVIVDVGQIIKTIDENLIANKKDT